MPGSIVHLSKMIRKTIYRLKWRYGCPIGLYSYSRGEYNPATGITEMTVSRIKITRAIVFPAEVHKNFFYSISFIRANSNFVTGGDVEIGDRQFIIDAKDLPRRYQVVLNQYIIWEHKRYDITKVYGLEYGTGWFINARQVKNNDVGEIHETKLSHTLTNSETYVGSK